MLFSLKFLKWTHFEPICLYLEMWCDRFYLELHLVYVPYMNLYKHGYIIKVFWQPFHNVVFVALGACAGKEAGQKGF